MPAPTSAEMLSTIAAMTPGERRLMRETLNPDARAERLAKERAAVQTELANIYNRALDRLSKIPAESDLPNARTLLSEQG